PTASAASRARRTSSVVAPVMVCTIRGRIKKASSPVGLKRLNLRVAAPRRARVYAGTAPPALEAHHHQYDAGRAWQGLSWKVSFTRRDDSTAAGCRVKPSP